MNITTTILTVGTALRHAHDQGTPVHVLVGTTWLDGDVVGVDGDGVVLVSPEGESIVVRMAGISAVRVERGHQAVPVTTSFNPYDDYTMPASAAAG